LPLLLSYRFLQPPPSPAFPAFDILIEKACYKPESHLRELPLINVHGIEPT
jgi:hypothetical protein